MVNRKNKELFSIIDELEAEMVKVDESFMSHIPNRLDKLDTSAKHIEKIAIKMQEHIANMRRK